MFSLRDLRFVLCSLVLEVVHAQRIMGFFLSITHKSTRSENPITWVETEASFSCVTNSYKVPSATFPAKLTFFFLLDSLLNELAK